MANTETKMWNWTRALLPAVMIIGGVACFIIPGAQAAALPLISGGIGLAGGTALKPIKSPSGE